MIRRQLHDSAKNEQTPSPLGTKTNGVRLAQLCPTGLVGLLCEGGLMGALSGCFQIHQFPNQVVAEFSRVSSTPSAWQTVCP